MITKLLRTETLAAAALLAAVGCKQDPAPKEKPTPQEPTPTEQPVEKQEPGATEQKPHSSAIPGTPNQIEHDDDIPNVSFKLAAPQDGQVLESGAQVQVEFDLRNYRTGKEIGQHVHVILDNNPYIAHYEADQPLVLEDVPPGTHTIRAFPARHYHLSLKQGDPFDIVTFHVEKKSEDFTFDPSKPYVTYSRPKGEYDQEAAKNLMLDFYVKNAELGKDAKVVYQVDDGEEQELTEWKPVLLDPLSPGEHKVTLKLVDMQGNLIENGGYNNTTRTITVK